MRLTVKVSFGFRVWVENRVWYIVYDWVRVG